MAVNQRRLTIIVALQVALLLTATVCAWGQQARRGKQSGTAVSYAYAGTEHGTRLEMSRERYVYSGGYFNADDGDIYALEVGMRPTEDIRNYGGVPFAVGAGWYHKQRDAGGSGDDFSVWAATGTFDHSRRGLFFQYRYIFTGAVKGGQAVVGWAF